MTSLTYIHEGQVGPTPLQALIQARKARLRRFEEAASRYQSKGQVTVDIQQSAILERFIETQAAKPRRDYETASHLSPHMPVARRVLIAVSREFGMPVDRIIAKSNEAKYCLPRFVAIGLMLELTKMSLPAIGRWLGGRDHTTVMNGRVRITLLLKSEAFRNRFDQIKAAVQG